MCPGVEPCGVSVPFLAALGWLDGFGRVGSFLPCLGALPVGDVRGVQLKRCEVLSLRPRQRAAVLAPDRGAWRNVYRQVRRIEHVAAQCLAQVQTVVVPKVGTESPAILPKEKREA